ncbi:MAG: hypothetical protein Q8Q23_01895 [bacterium]|nr:hypothetical protein [bacterium]
MLDKEFIAKMKTKLEEEKVIIEQKISDLTKPEKSADNPDFDDLAYDAAEDIIEESTLSAYRNVLEKIENALLRIKNGAYGVDITSGKEITRERLEEEPWAEEVAPINQ